MKSYQRPQNAYELLSLEGQRIFNDRNKQTWIEQFQKKHAWLLGATITAVFPYEYDLGYAGAEFGKIVLNVAGQRWVIQAEDSAWLTVKSESEENSNVDYPQP